MLSYAGFSYIPLFDLRCMAKSSVHSKIQRSFTSTLTSQGALATNLKESHTKCLPGHSQRSATGSAGQPFHCQHICVCCHHCQHCTNNFRTLLTHSSCSQQLGRAGALPWKQLTDDKYIYIHTCTHYHYKPWLNADFGWLEKGPPLPPYCNHQQACWAAKMDFGITNLSGWTVNETWLLYLQLPQTGANVSRINTVASPVHHQPNLFIHMT